MLKQVTATRFIRKMSNGRTIPCLFECEDEDGNSFEIVVKFSERLYEKETSLAYEAISAILAADLGLPIPEPFIVKFDDDIIDGVSDATIKSFIQSSCRLGFGLRLVTGFSVWQQGKNISATMTQDAAQIIVFDQIIINSDRRPDNPNCQYLEDDFLIYDHELAFTRALFWKAPWEDGGMDDLSDRTKHIFAGPYFVVKPSELNSFIDAWKKIPKNRFVAYKNALPKEWLIDNLKINNILDHLSSSQDNIQIIVNNAIKVLTS
jgi:hypothetical protein